jgi:hypothetical protein
MSPKGFHVEPWRFWQPGSELHPSPLPNLQLFRVEELPRP